MPLLEYRCAACGALFERLVPRTEGAERADCPTCDAPPPSGRRILSVFASVRGGDGASLQGAASGGCCGGGCGCG